MVPGLIALIVVLGLVVVGVIAMYNGLVRSRRQAMNAWAQIDVQLKRRYDLIPNLVETAKAAMDHEQETLEKVIQARNMAIKADGVGDQAKAEGALTGALTGFFGLMEQYPNLKANENLLALQGQLEKTEAKISYARQYYNDSVTAYNTKLETFPSSIIAGMSNFQPKELFLLEDPVQREPVKVKF